MRLMAGLLTPTEGEVVIDDLNYGDNRDQIHHMIGYMPQKFAILVEAKRLCIREMKAD